MFPVYLPYCVSASLSSPAFLHLLTFVLLFLFPAWHLLSCLLCCFFYTTAVFCMMCFVYVLCQLAHASFVRVTHPGTYPVTSIRDVQKNLPLPLVIHSLPALFLFLPFLVLLQSLPPLCKSCKVPYCGACARQRHCVMLSNFNRKCFFLSRRTSSSMPINFNRMHFAPSCRAFSSMPIDSNRTCFSLSCRTPSSMPINFNICVFLSPVGRLVQCLLTLI